MLNSKEADFILRGDGEVIYPEISKDGLEMYYDVKGKKNSDKHKDKLLDMSGQGKDGELSGFDYGGELSGYDGDNGIVFDGIDDKLVRADVEDIEEVSATRNLFDTRGLNTSKTYISGLKPNTDYTMSSNVPEITNHNLYFGTLTIGVDETGSHTIKSDSDGMVWYQIYPSREHTQDLIDGTYWIQLEEGSTATPYVPYIPTAKMTYQLNNNVISYGEDSSVKWVKDGKVMNRKGINLIRNGNFWNGTNGWNRFQSNISVTNNGSLKVENNGGASYAQVWRYIYLAPRSKYYFRTKFEVGNKNTNAGLSGWFHGGEKKNEKSYEYELVKENTSEEINRQQMKFSDSSTLGDYYYISDIQLINLTATFGAGNEPTLEEIQADPDKWQWLPNPMDLLEAKELKGNILGDMEDIVDASPRDRQSGKKVFTEHADDSHVEVEVDGKSTQLTNENILENIELIQGAYINATTDYKGGLSTSGFFITKPFPVEGLTNLDATITIPSAYENLRVMFLDASLNKISYFVEPTALQAIWNVPSGAVYAVFCTHENDGNEYTLKANVPTPESPIEIHSLNDFDVVSSVGRENIFLLSKFKDIPSHSSSVVSLIKNGFRLTNTYSYAIHFAKPDLKPGKTYTISGEVVIRSGTGNGIEGRFVSLTKDAAKVPSIMLYYGGGGKFTSTFSTPTDFNYDNYHGLHAYGVSTKAVGIPGVVDFINIKIEEGKDQTPYSLSSEEISENTENQFIDKINLPLSEPLRSSGDVKDRIFRDSDGLWKIERNVGEKVLDGSEFWARTSSQTFYVMHSSIRNIDRGKEGAISNKYKSGRKQGDWGSQDTVVQNTDSGRLYFFPKKEYSTLDGWKNYLESEFNNNTPVVVHYWLASPVIETLDQELQDQLNTLKSFKDSNYVYTVQNTDSLHKEQLKPILHATFNSKDYLKETRTLTNLLIWARELTDEELIHHNQLFLNRFNLHSDRVIGEPIEQTLNLLHGGMVGHSLEQNYTINI